MTPSFPCARCGTRLRRRPRMIGGRGTLTIGCPKCRYLIFDYPRPCTGFVVTKGDSMLLLRRAHAPKRGKLDLPGGFLEAHEDLEAGARRELLEETGLRVGKAKSFGFYWDRYYLRGFGWFPTMNFYFLAPWRSGTPQAGDDAATCEWVPVAEAGTRGHQFAWTHMHDVLKELRQRRRRRRP